MGITFANFQATGTNGLLEVEHQKQKWGIALSCFEDIRSVTFGY